MADLPTKYLGIRIPMDLAEKMDLVLATDGMMITEYVRGLIREDLRERGLIGPDFDREQPAAEATR